MASSLPAPLLEARELVVTAALGYSADKLATFASSLRGTGCTAPILAFMYWQKAEDRARLQSWGVYPVLPSELGSPLARGLGKRLHRPRAARLLRLWRRHQTRLGERALDFRARLVAAVHHGVVARLLYYQLLLPRLPTWQRVLLSDCRDVYFQTDPFRSCRWDRLHLGLEAEPATIGLGHPSKIKKYHWSEPSLGATGYNAHWIYDAYGTDTLSAYFSRPICCSGVTYGPRAALLDYVRKMAIEALRLRPTLIGEFGFDQTR
jgi:hypothetical protein